MEGRDLRETAQAAGLRPEYLCELAQLILHETNKGLEGHHFSGDYVKEKAEKIVTFVLDLRQAQAMIRQMEEGND